MAFSRENQIFSDKQMLIKAIQTMNQHLPGKRQPLGELMTMDKPGIKSKDNTFFIMDKAELDLISKSLPRFMWNRLRLPLLIEMSPDFGSGSARIQGEVETEVVSKLLGKERRMGDKFMIIYMPEVRELRRKLPTTTQYAFVASIREDFIDE